MTPAKTIKTANTMADAMAILLMIFQLLICLHQLPLLPLLSF
jgi:hypothetical protein